MACLPGSPPACLGAVGDAAGGLATGVLGNGFADAMRDGAAWVIKTTIGWWIAVPSLNLPAPPAPPTRPYVLWLAVVVPAAGVMWQGIILALSRRTEAALDVGRGLFTL